MLYTECKQRLTHLDEKTENSPLSVTGLKKRERVEEKGGRTIIWKHLQTKLL